MTTATRGRAAVSSRADAERAPARPRGGRTAWPWAGMVLLLHLLVFGPALDPGTNAVLLTVNLFALFCALRYRKALSEARFVVFLAGYLALFILFYAVARSPLLFATFGMLYAAAFRHPVLLGLLALLVASLVLVPAYWVQATLLGGLLYVAAMSLWAERRHRFALTCLALGFLLVAAVMLPLLYLGFLTTPQTLLTTFGEPAFRQALYTTLATATASTAIVLLLGVPLAYAMARLEFRGKGLLDSLIDLPIVIPQSVVGIAILVTFGPKTDLGRLLQRTFGTGIEGSALGIIVCQVFVSMPFLVRSAMNAFEDMGPELEHVSRTLGATPRSAFFRVSLPLAGGAIFNGCILAWARAVSEFGSLLIVAYKPFTVSTYARYVFDKYGLLEAQAASVLLVIVCMWGFLVLRWMRATGMRRLCGQARRGAA